MLEKAEIKWMVVDRDDHQLLNLRVLGIHKHVPRFRDEYAGNLEQQGSLLR
jgi:hypothetical protein